MTANKTPADATRTEVRKSQEDDAFAEFWNLYPRREAKLDARKAFHQTAKQNNLAVVMQGLRRQLDWLLEREVKHRPLAATWLRGQRWEDEIVASPKLRSNGKRPSYVERVANGDIDGKEILGEPR